MNNKHKLHFPCPLVGGWPEVGLPSCVSNDLYTQLVLDTIAGHGFMVKRRPGWIVSGVLVPFRVGETNWSRPMAIWLEDPRWVLYALNEHALQNGREHADKALTLDTLLKDGYVGVLAHLESERHQNTLLIPASARRRQPSVLADSAETANAASQREPVDP